MGVTSATMLPRGRVGLAFMALPWERSAKPAIVMPRRGRARAFGDRGRALAVAHRCNRFARGASLCLLRHHPPARGQRAVDRERRQSDPDEAEADRAFDAEVL